MELTIFHGQLHFEINFLRSLLQVELCYPCWPDWTMVVSTIDRVDRDVKQLCRIKTYED